METERVPFLAKPIWRMSFSVESKDEYAFEYVGVLILPKGFGHQETSHIGRKNEVQ